MSSYAPGDVRNDPAYRARFPERFSGAAVEVDQLDRGYQDAYLTWLRNGAGGLSRDQRAALEVANAPNAYAERLRKLAAFRGPGADELRALSTSNTAGGYTVPAALLDRMFIALKRSSAMVRAATVVDTEGGQPTSLPLLDDTGVSGAIISEAGAHTVDSATPFATKALPAAYLYSSKIIKVSLQLAQDTAFPIDRWLPWVLARRIGRGLNPHLTNGTGGGAQPVGLVPNTTVGVTGSVGSTTSLTYDNAVDLIASVDPEYLEPLDEAAPVLGASAGHVGFMGSKAALAMLRKVKDTAGAPIVTEGLPPKVLGYDFLVNPDVPAPAANAKSLLFGSFPNGYLVRRVTGDVIVLRLSELYQENLQLGFLAFGRFDGTPADAAACRAYAHSAT